MMHRHIVRCAYTHTHDAQIHTHTHTNKYLKNKNHFNLIVGIWTYFPLYLPLDVLKIKVMLED